MWYANDFGEFNDEVDCVFSFCNLTVVRGGVMSGARVGVVESVCRPDDGAGGEVGDSGIDGARAGRSLVLVSFRNVAECARCLVGVSVPIPYKMLSISHADVHH